MANDYAEKLIEYGKNLEVQGQILIDASVELQKSEEQYKLLRAKVYNLDRVQNQPNQVLRESEADIIMQNDERFKPLYVEYLTQKLLQKQAYYRFDVLKELNANYRTLVNSVTYGKE